MYLCLYLIDNNIEKAFVSNKMLIIIQSVAYQLQNLLSSCVYILEIKGKTSTCTYTYYVFASTLYVFIVICLLSIAILHAGT